MKTTTYCLKCRNQTPDVNPRYIKSRPNKIRKASNCGNCGTKKANSTH